MRDQGFEGVFNPVDGRPLILVTTHRRESFDGGIENICDAIQKLSQELDVEFVIPVHPNPHVREPVSRCLRDCSRVHLVDPLGYREFVDLLGRCTMVMTDSGGIQEEAPSLRKPVVVLRETTERPEVVEVGAARLVGTDPETIVSTVRQILEDPEVYRRMAGARNPFGDGRASERIADILYDELAPSAKEMESHADSHAPLERMG